MSDGRNHSYALSFDGRAGAASQAVSAQDRGSSVTKVPSPARSLSDGTSLVLETHSKSLAECLKTTIARPKINFLHFKKD